MKGKLFALLATACSTMPVMPTLFVGVTATTIAIFPTIIAPPPVSAAWWDNVTGVYINVGSPYYFGTYVQNPDPQFQGSTWEIMCGSNVCAHGYNQSIPRFVWWLGQRLGG